MFKIQDGRECFYQWDLNRYLVVEDSSIKQVHYCNRTGDCSLVCNVFEKDGELLACVPNVILQSAWPVNVYGYDQEYTKHSKTFKVKPRTKPEDYIYTEEEIKTWESLTERIDEIETNGISQEAIDSAISKYLEEHPIDLTDYATTEYVDNAVSNVTVDLTGYATEDYVDDAIANIDIPEGSSAEEVYIGTEAPTDPSIKVWVDTDAEATDLVDLSGYALKTDIPSVEGLATEKYVDDAIGNINTLLDDINGEVI